MTLYKLTCACEACDPIITYKFLINNIILQEFSLLCFCLKLFNGLNLTKAQGKVFTIHIMHALYNMLHLNNNIKCIIIACMVAQSSFQVL